MITFQISTTITQMQYTQVRSGKISL
uniref:Uncharacterized protein n=1 Tax=Arundo donax TaxID=35708 RepID=A0A0A8Z4N6_ARUDO